MEIKIVCLEERPELISAAALWFSQKWDVPREAYAESMAQSLSSGQTVPRWYLALAGEKIVAGLGVIENDFHDRPDLAPNVCAVYTEPEFRRQGMAGQLLNRVCRDMKELGVPRLYLLTDLVGFYEKYGWVYHCQAQIAGDPQPTQVYTHWEEG